MAIVALYPERHGDFTNLARLRGSKITDPMLNALTERRATQTDKDLFVSWFFTGITMTEALRSLNGAFVALRKSTRYERQALPIGAAAWRLITRSLQSGFPVVLAWDTYDEGNHCVTVVGYRHGARDKYHIVQDPGSGWDRVGWRYLKGQADGNELEILTAREATHTGPRPDRLVEYEDESRQLLRYWPDEDGAATWSSVHEQWANASDREA